MTYTCVWDAMQNQVSDQMIQRDEDGAFVPFDPDNMDYQDYLAWLDEGNQPYPVQGDPTPLPSDASNSDDAIQALTERVEDLEAMVIPR
jgi:hypothetical protein